MIAVFLQVRLDSTRLPQKALKRLGTKTITEHCLAALERIPADRFVLVTEPGSAAVLQELIQGTQWQLFVGSKYNVLDRFVQAGRHFGVSTIIRATGDNPLVCYERASRLLELHQQAQADYSGFLQAPVGTGVEILSFSALERAWSAAPDAFEQEHVGPALYRHPDRFRIQQPAVPPAFQAPQARVTLDTAEDFEYLENLWQACYRGQPLRLQEILPWLRENPR